MPDTPLPIRPEAAELGTSLIRLTRLLHAVKQHAPSLHPEVEGAAYPLLFTLAGAPCRVSALAEATHLDISTVSRLITALAGSGLVEKVPDPTDGRAQVVELTDQGESLLTQIRDVRNGWLTGLLSDWSDEDLATCTGHLNRLSETLAGFRAQVLAGDPATGSTPTVPTRQTEVHA